MRLVWSRCGHALLVLWGALTLTFLALHLTRGSVVDAIVGNNTQVTPAVRAQIVQDYGLGRPLWQQYLSYLGRLLHGDLGTSYQLQTPVRAAIAEQLPPTLQLMGLATLLAVTTTLVVAVATARRPAWLRAPFALLEVAGVAVPQFWLAILLLTVFSFGLHWFPAFADGPAGLVLPAVALAVPMAGILTQLLRDGLERALEQPFATTARARGQRERGVLVRHALRHALPPALTIFGLLLGSMIGGAVVVEQVFSRPGIGSLLLTAVTGKDIPVVLGVVAVTATGYVAINLIVDLLYPLLDPRLKD
ncbi:ABC transporter permease [Micromonospora wenchangensis]|uniref:ABC transporter permease n=1 Tax=Micromonospora wenchangensis TaxID=1185415 RepID=A0A246RFC5_9ACTN|nr:ABC transporter permease [Micromonospora wenchangensis]OWV01487.1 ABC transporter permease [Micromonospora wenchangensis]